MRLLFVFALLAVCGVQFSQGQDTSIDVGFNVPIDVDNRPRLGTDGDPGTAIDPASTSPLLEPGAQPGPLIPTAALPRRRRPRRGGRRPHRGTRRPRDRRRPGRGDTNIQVDFNVPISVSNRKLNAIPAKITATIVTPEATMHHKYE